MDRIPSKGDTRIPKTPAPIRQMNALLSIISIVSSDSELSMHHGNGGESHLERIKLNQLEGGLKLDNSMG